MSQARADFAIVGSSPLALLVAGLLAATHGRSVILAGDGQAAFRLARGMDLSVAPLTRPEAWALLKGCVPETIRAIARIGGRAAWSRIDPMLVADTEAAREALSHVRHMALAFGHDVEPVAHYANQARDGILIRDAILLHRGRLEAILDGWFAQHRVRRVLKDERLTIAANGSAVLETASGDIEITQSVLADDLALIGHLPEKQWPDLLARREASTLLVAPAAPLAAPLMSHIDSGLMMLQQPDRSVTALGPGPLQGLIDQVSEAVGPGLPLRQSGQSRHESVTTGDGAAAVGRLAGTGPDVLAGLGISGAFLAPAIARWLAGVADAQENAYFAARLVNRDPAQSDVADVGGAT